MTDDTHYIRDGVRYPRVSLILANARRFAFAGVPAYLLEEARLRGRAVHAAIEFANAGTLDEATVHESIRGYVESFYAWRDVLKPETVRSEFQMVSARYRFGGRSDWKCRLAGRHRGLWVIDYKTGSPNPADALQTAAYWALDREAEPGRGVVLRAALYLHRDGRPATFVPHDNPNDLAMFLSYRNVYEWEELTYGNGNEPRDR